MRAILASLVLLAACAGARKPLCHPPEPLPGEKSCWLLIECKEQPVYPLWDCRLGMETSWAVNGVVMPAGRSTVAMSGDTVVACRELPSGACCCGWIENLGYGSPPS